MDSIIAMETKARVRQHCTNCTMFTRTGKGWEGGKRNGAIMHTQSVQVTKTRTYLCTERRKVYVQKSDNSSIIEVADQPGAGWQALCRRNERINEHGVS